MYGHVRKLILFTGMFFAFHGHSADPVLVEFVSGSTGLEASIDENSGEATIQVRLAQPKTSTTYIYFNKSGSASSSDYRLSRSSFRIPAGETIGSITITGRQDTRIEGDEELLLELRSSYGIALSQNKFFRVLIRDDDGQSEGDDEVPDTDMITWCGSVSGVVSASYCTHRTVGSQSQDVLYYFHGAYGSQFFWLTGASVEYRKAMRLHWQASGQDAPIVVVISLGMTWLLTENANPKGPATFNDMADNIIPAIERDNFLLQSGGRRLLMGISMGGFNALQLYMKRPEMWSRAAFIAPLMPLCDPFLASSALMMCVAGDPYNSQFFQTYSAHGLVSGFFPTPAEWNAVNPNILGQTTLNPQSPPMLMSTGTNDEFGFFARNLDFANLAEDKGVDIIWAPTDGLHGHHDVELFGNFILEY